MSDETELNQLAFFAEVSHARTSPLPEKGRALMESGLDYSSSLLDLLRSLRRHGYYLKMSPAFYPVTEGKTLPPSFEGWGNSGMAWPGGSLTLNTSEYHSAAVASTLSDILLHDDDPWVKRKFKTVEAFRDWLRKYYLSAKACSGILRRAAKRGKDLPETLKRVLEATALSHSPSDKETGTEEKDT
jgi:cobalamin biosynthesis Mg chelatase CobN